MDHKIIKGGISSIGEEFDADFIEERRQRRKK